MTTKLTMLAQWRLMLDSARRILLEFRRSDGSAEAFMVSPNTLRQMRGKFAGLLNHPAAPRDLHVDWEANRYQTTPGPNGGFEVAVLHEEKLAVLKIRDPIGFETELLLPVDDLRPLVRGLAEALSVIEAPSSSTSH